MLHLSSLVMSWEPRLRGECEQVNALLQRVLCASAACSFHLHVSFAIRTNANFGSSSELDLCL